MECKEIQDLMSAYVDRELALREALAIEQHLPNCVRCQTQYAEHTKLRTALKNDAAYFKAPNHLAQRIKLALPSAALQKSHAPLRAWSWLNFGAVLASIIAIAWSTGLYFMLPSANDRLMDELISNHVRSLQVAHSTDVASSDLHTVKPWFNGKLDFSPPVFDLTTEGFPLIGGRMDYFNHRSTAALVYRHRQHIINLFIAPLGNRKDISPERLTRQGYYLTHWIHNGMAFWAVSDVDPSQLEKFREIFLASMSR
ncbi:MAG: anti-sigma factor [Gammaproteobacteria bacterium]|nr:anti-sigma factor [Gammaproteobacteria bacterium]